jgi:hypothetical protein
MQLFIWQCVSNLTNRYHDGGGLVIVAQNLDAARELLRQTDGVLTERIGDIDRCCAFDIAPNVVYELHPDTTPSVRVFPDAGCC